MFCHSVNCLIKIMQKHSLIGSQTTVDDLPFSYKIGRMNSCTSILQGEIHCHSLAKKCPLRRLWVKQQAKYQMITPGERLG